MSVRSRFSEDRPSIQFYGDLLTDAGYKHLGKEVMYSGVDGQECEVGVVQLQCSCLWIRKVTEEFDSTM